MDHFSAMIFENLYQFTFNTRERTLDGFSSLAKGL
jgi:hypothetical protein